MGKGNAPRIPKPPVQIAAEQNAAQRRAELQRMAALLGHQQERIEKLAHVQRELVNAANNASLMLSCVEKFLDKLDANWDAGTRERLKAKMEKLKQVKRLVLHGSRDGLKPYEYIDAGRELAELAEAIEQPGELAADVLRMFTKARRIDLVLQHAEALQKAEVEVPPEVTEIVEQAREFERSRQAPS